jgi:hypothetical protein
MCHRKSRHLPPRLTIPPHTRTSQLPDQAHPLVTRTDHDLASGAPVQPDRTRRDRYAVDNPRVALVFRDERAGADVPGLEHPVG